MHVAERRYDLTPLVCIGCRNLITDDDHMISDKVGVRTHHHHKCVSREAYDQMREQMGSDVEWTGEPRPIIPMLTAPKLEQLMLA